MPTKSVLRGVATLVCVSVAVISPRLTPDTGYFNPAQAESGPPLSTKQAWRLFEAQHGTEWKAEWDAAFGTPKRLEGAYSRPFPGDPQEAAQQFLSENRALFRLQANLADLRLAYRRESLIGTHLAYKQSYAGLPVFNGDIAVHLDQANRVFLVHNYYIPVEALAPLNRTPTLSIQEAVEYTLQQVDPEQAARAMSNPDRSPPGSELGIYRTADGNHLAYRFVAAGIEYVTDAHSGEILDRTELAHHFRHRRSGGGDSTTTRSPVGDSTRSGVPPAIDGVGSRSH